MCVLMARCPLVYEFDEDHFLSWTNSHRRCSDSRVPANEITNTQVKQQNLLGEANITQEHVKNNRDVRKLLTDRQIVPEDLPVAEDVKKLERRLKSEEKKLLAQTTRLLGKSSKKSGNK